MKKTGNGGGSILGVYRRTVNDRLLTLEQRGERIEVEQGKMANRMEEVFRQVFERFDDWDDKWAKQGRPNWVVIVSFLGVVVTGAALGFSVMMAALGVFWFIITGQVNGQVGPVRSELGIVHAQSDSNTLAINSVLLPNATQALSENKASLKAERDMEDRITRQNDAVSRLTNRVTKQGQALREIETQFAENDETRNIQFADQQRTNADARNALNQLGATIPAYPPGPFYHPRISRGLPAPDGDNGD